jgi:hypothetical protein
MIVRLFIVGDHVFEWNPMGYLVTGMGVLSVLFITGGVFCLRRKYWGLCLTSSVLLFVSMPPLSAYLVEGLQHLYNFLQQWLWMSLIAVWILPVIFVSLRKSEWQEVWA